MDVKNDLGGGKPTLLIAEDEESNYLLLKTILHKYCNLIRAKTGLEALALFKENEVDLILMDIKMPEMTGIESLKEIRKLSKDIPVIMQSAYVFDSDMEAARSRGFWFYHEADQSKGIEKYDIAVLSVDRMVRIY